MHAAQYSWNGGSLCVLSYRSFGATVVFVRVRETWRSKKRTIYAQSELAPIGFCVFNEECCGFRCRAGHGYLLFTSILGVSQRQISEFDKILSFTLLPNLIWSSTKWIQLTPVQNQYSQTSLWMFSFLFFFVPLILQVVFFYLDGKMSLLQDYDMYFPIGTQTPGSLAFLQRLSLFIHFLLTLGFGPFTVLYLHETLLVFQVIFPVPIIGNSIDKIL